MKFLAFVTLFLAFDTFSKPLDINLKAVDSVKITCPEGLVLVVAANTAKCACPSGTWAHFDDEDLMCGSLCEIKIVTEEVTIYDECDQCLSGDRVVGIEKHKVLKLVKNLDKTLYRDRLYSPRQSEVDMLFREAISVAEKQCDKTIYNGKEVK